MSRFLVVALVVGACGTTPGEPGARYLDDRGFRRAELEASLVEPSDGYARLRLVQYATPQGGWDAFDEWNPQALELTADPADDDALRALGEAAFFGYPMQPLPAAAAGLALARYGLRSASLAQVATGLALTCASCHATERDGVVVPGLTNTRFDFGRLLAEAGAVPGQDVARFRAWGPGRVDVTTAEGGEPVRIADLRAVRWQGYLQADATLRQRDLVTLAIRIETLMITAHAAQQVRPPRLVSLGLATYVWSLADALPPLPPSTARGADVFARACAGCHAPPALTGEPIALDVIGTDPTVGRSADRGTGAYRVPSLHGVGTRDLLLHDGAVASLAAMFDPARVAVGYAGGVRPGPVAGHTFGLDLDARARADLLAYLEIL